MYNNRSKVW